MSKLTMETNKYGQVRVKVETTKSGQPFTYRAPENTGLSGQNDQAIAAIVDKINEMDDADGELETRVENIEKVIPEGTTEENQLVNEAGLAKAAGSVQDEGALTDGASVEVTNNSVQTLSTSRSAITVNVTPEDGQSPNFALEIAPSQDLTITVTKTVGSTVTTLYPSEAGGNVAYSGGYYQLTCVGNCWTLAPFTVPVTP